MTGVLITLTLLAQLWPNPGPGRPGAGGGGGGTPLISNQVLGTAKNDYTGCIGGIFNVGASGISVTELGRWVISGNSGSHVLAITDGSGTALGSCTVNLSGATPGEYKYCVLGSPVALNAFDSSIRIVSHETNGGDQWYGMEDTTVTTTAAVSWQGANYGTTSGANCTSPTTIAPAPASYVPVNLKYN